MRHRFRSNISAGGIETTLVDRPLLGRSREIAIEEWPQFEQTRAVARRLLALLDEGRAVIAGPALQMSHAVAAELPSAVAEKIGLPPVGNVRLDLLFDGRVDSTHGQIRLQWKDGSMADIRPQRTGLLLEWGEQRCRLSASLLRLVEAIEAFNVSLGQSFDERVATWMPVQEALQSSLGHDVKADGYASRLTIHQAGAFALDVRETSSGVDFVPILMARSKITTMRPQPSRTKRGGNSARPIMICPKLCLCQMTTRNSSDKHSLIINRCAMPTHWGGTGTFFSTPRLRRLSTLSN
jgi:hypothetical protein